MDNKKRKLKIIVIGCGYWGVNYVRLLNQFPGIDLVAVCEKSDKRIKQVRELFPTINIIKDFSIMYEEDFDAAIVSTDPHSHYEITKRLLEWGKHVLVEKPLTIKSHEARQLIQLSQAKNLILMVGHIFLYNPGVIKVKQLVNEGKAGKLLYLYAQRTNLGPIRMDVNVLWDLAPHDISIFNFLMNANPEWVSAVGASYLQPDRADVGFFSMGYPNGVIGNIHVSWVEPNKERKVVVVGTEGKIVFNDLSQQEKVILYKKGVRAASSLETIGYGAYQAAVRNGDVYIPNLEMHEPLERQMVEFINCIQKNKQPITDGVNGYQVVKILEALDKSMISNGTHIKIDPDEGE